MEISLNTFLMGYITISLGFILGAWVLFIRWSGRSKSTGSFIKCDCCGAKIYYPQYTQHVRCKKCGKRNEVKGTQSLSS
jgi:DNA-directed RNA polymerase subunit RPC12/RpoP